MSRRQSISFANRRTPEVVYDPLEPLAQPVEAQKVPLLSNFTRLEISAVVVILGACVLAWSLNLLPSIVTLTRFLERASIPVLVVAVVIAAVALVIAERGRLSEEKACIAAKKALFFAEMRVIAFSRDTSSMGRGSASEPSIISEEDFFAGFPAVAPSVIEEMWTQSGAQHRNIWKAPTGRKPDENRDIHCAVAAVLNATVATWLRVWGNDHAEDDVPAAKIGPDFTATDARDTSASTIGSLLMIEVKLPGDIVGAVRKTCLFLRRRVFKLCCERNDSGMRFDDVCAYGIATDGVYVVLVYVESGAPAPGASCVGTTDKPCPAFVTDQMPLFRNRWIYNELHAYRNYEPTSGFAAIARLLQAPRAILGEGAPISDLCAVLDLLPAARAPQAVVSNVLLMFGRRLGSGGSSDIYELTSCVPSAGGIRADLTNCVLKVARVPTAAVKQSFEAERMALQALRHAASTAILLAGFGTLVPELVGYGNRKAESSWPLLLLRPQGMQLTAWVRARVAAGCQTPAATAARRRECALDVTLRALRAVSAAHAVGIVHCDVRPSNIIVNDDRAVLADWGSSRCTGVDSAGCGVAAYASMDVFWQTPQLEALTGCLQNSYKARPAQDVAAVLYTWMCIAFDGECMAPWLDESSHGIDDMYTAREAWISNRSDSDESFASIAAILHRIERDSRCGHFTQDLALATEHEIMDYLQV